MHASLTGPANSGGDGTALDIDARKVEVLVGVGVSAPLQLEDAQVPVGGVGRGRRRHGRHDLLEGRAAFRVPEPDGARATELLHRCVATSCAM